MSSSTKSGGIGIGTIIFWIIIWNVIFDDDDEKEVNVVVEENDKQSITETLKETVDNLKPEAQELISKAKEELIKVKESFKEEETPKVKEDPKPKKIDSFEQDDDLYGSTEDKW